MQCNLDRLINRDDDAKRSPLSAKHVAGFVFVTIGRRQLMTVLFPSFARNWRRWSHSERSSLISCSSQLRRSLSWTWYQRRRQRGHGSRIFFFFFGKSFMPTLFFLLTSLAVFVLTNGITLNDLISVYDFIKVFFFSIS